MSHPGSQRLASQLSVFIAACLLVTLARAADPAQQGLLDADAERVAALLAADTGRLGRLFAEQLSYVHTTGALDGKAALLGKIKAGELVFQSIQPHDVVAHVYGSAGVVTGTAELHVLNAHQPRVLSLRFTATYVQHDGHWQLAAYQSTQLAD